MNNRIGIFGTSGMARETGDIAHALNLLPVYIAQNAIELDACRLNADVILEEDIHLLSNMQFIIGVGENSIRKRIFNKYSMLLDFTNLIHPSATFGFMQRQAVESSKGTIVCAGVRFTSNIAVGDCCIFNQNVAIAHDVSVGSFVHVAPGSIISGNVSIGTGSWIGAGSVINQGSPSNKMCIGHDVVIGSGAVVISSCDANATYVGVPAKRIK